jgi:hypothetical protein
LRQTIGLWGTNTGPPHAIALPRRAASGHAPPCRASDQPYRTKTFTP